MHKLNQVKRFAKLQEQNTAGITQRKQEQSGRLTVQVEAAKSGGLYFVSFVAYQQKQRHIILIITSY